MSWRYVMKPDDSAATHRPLLSCNSTRYVSTFSRVYASYPKRLMYSLMSPARSAKRRSRSTKVILKRSAIRAATVLLPAPPGPIRVMAKFSIPSATLRTSVLQCAHVDGQAETRSAADDVSDDNRLADHGKPPVLSAAESAAA